MKQLDYYFWLNSDWALLGADRLALLAQRQDVQVNYKPVDLLDVYARTGGIPLSRRSVQRQDYREQELRRWMPLLGMQINVTPRYMCPDASLASRFLIAAELLGYPVAQLHKEILAAQWCHEQDIAQADVLLGVAARLGLPGPAMMQRAAQPEAERQYRRYTDEAVSAGVFGSPSYVLAGEVFWGQDRLDFLDRALAG
ncbi:2-hydroxychromene-2-carboxylate isomerase [Castellaniella defragrans 65Phen]|uniref:2-hydroxychromene-2-carboxylate isomerase n=1 Tax=Castellaniella defragrans (strain DSM 12143 / CCUG 39792 / 65Phen) TaxID=1437824 RepID=W8XA28_CASD6|nr:2-hydroxychromene-2-carboxylate isomerase [Castellaniella defragrans]CDM25850.1 2-hydroxychromene-2-carboxylate isomerase [Castellaniella defragrans 65Phen]